MLVRPLAREPPALAFVVVRLWGPLARRAALAVEHSDGVRDVWPLVTPCPLALPLVLRRPWPLTPFVVAATATTCSMGTASGSGILVS